MKALNNFLAAISLWAASEALVVGAKSGLDPATMIAVWQKSSGNSDAVQVKMPRSTLPRTFDYGFSVGLMAKDLAIAAGIARDVDASAPLIAQQAATWALAREALGFDRDMTAVITLIESWARPHVTQSRRRSRWPAAASNWAIAGIGWPNTTRAAPSPTPRPRSCSRA
jgi:3-hydroxyisobutyrate dehydrogenase-like beta-hydroxyacid dehydrogenase